MYNIVRLIRFVPMCMTRYGRYGHDKNNMFYENARGKDNENQLSADVVVPRALYNMVMNALFAQ